MTTEVALGITCSCAMPTSAQPPAGGTMTTGQRRVVRALLADRAEQQAAEATQAARSDHEHVRLMRLLEQDIRRVALLDHDSSCRSSGYRARTSDT